MNNDNPAEGSNLELESLRTEHRELSGDHLLAAAREKGHEPTKEAGGYAYPDAQALAHGQVFVVGNEDGHGAAAALEESLLAFGFALADEVAGVVGEGQEVDPFHFRARGRVVAGSCSHTLSM